MKSDELSKTVADFVSLTGIAADQARFFVESAGGDLETALSTYYDTTGTASSDTGAPISTTAPTRHAGPATLAGEPADEMPAEWRRPTSHSQKLPDSKPSRSGGIKSFADLTGSSSAPQANRIRGISTLKDLNSSGVSGSGDMSEDEDEDETDGAPDLYAGGGRSGLNVQDPNQQNIGKASGIVADILKKAKEAGIAPPNASNTATTSKSTPFFQGAAQTLGSDEVSSQPVPPMSAGAARRQGKSFSTALPVPGHFGSDEEEDDDFDGDDDEEEVEKHLTFWKDGFSIEDGPLLSYDDPKNKEILDAINRGRAPLDLLGVRLNQRVTMRVQKRLTENYIPPPKQPAKPFSGSGNRLGSPLPAAALAMPAPSPPSAVPSEASIIFEVDNNLPVTSVQIRLGDGSRMITRLNHTHTISDIRRQIAASNPDLAGRPYALQTTFPSRDLNDEGQTIKDAGVLGAVVVQRFL